MRNMTKTSTIIILFSIIVLISSCGHLKEAKQHYNSKNYEKTVLLCKKALKNNSKDTQAMLIMAKSYLATENLSEALKISLKAYNLNSSSKKIKSVLTEIHNSIGDEYSTDNKYKALSHYKSSIELSPKNLCIQKKIADLYFNLGELKKAEAEYSNFLKSGGNSTGISKIKHRIRERLKNSEIYFKKGLVYYDKTTLYKAKEYFIKSLDQHSSSENSNYYLNMTKGRLLYITGSINDLWNAIEFFGNAAAINSTSAPPYYWMGLSYNKKDRDEYTNAIDCFEKYLKIDPDGKYSGKCRVLLKKIKTRKKKMDAFWGRDK